MISYLKMPFFYSILFLLGILASSQQAICETDLQTLNFQQLNETIDQAQGKVVLVNFWATWCVPCRKELPSLHKLRKEYSKKDLLILGPTLDTYPSSVKRFIKKYNLDFPVFFVTEDVQRAYQVSALPKTLLFNRQGRLEMNHLGLLSEDELRSRIEDLLEEH